MSVNKFIGIGNLTRNPDTRYSQQGTAVTNFSIACNEKWFDKNTNQQQERVEFINVVTFGKLAETCEEYLAKGRQCYVEGKLVTSTFDKEGQTHYSTKVQAQTVQFLGSKQDNQQGQQGNNQGQYSQHEQNVRDHVNNKFDNQNQPPQGS